MLEASTYLWFQDKPNWIWLGSSIYTTQSVYSGTHSSLIVNK